MTADHDHFIGPGQGSKYRALGTEFELRVPGERTKGAYFAFSFEIPPGGEIPPHVHETTEELVIVLEGECTNSVEGRKETQGPGSLCLIPRGTPHGQTNTSDGPTRVLVVISPPDTEGLFEKIDGKADEEVVSIMEQHGMTFVR